MSEVFCPWYRCNLGHLQGGGKRRLKVSPIFAENILIFCSWKCDWLELVWLIKRFTAGVISLQFDRRALTVECLDMVSPINFGLLL